MKKNKIIFSIIIFIFVFITAFMNNQVQAAPLNPNLYFGIAELRTTTNMGYAMGDPDSGAEKIWKIVQYSNTNFDDPTEVSAYCIKANVGFTDEGSTDVYDVSYNMKTERDAIAEQNDILHHLVNDGQYDNLLALADLLYVKGVSTQAERQQLLDESKASDIVEKSDFNGVADYYITDDEIDAVQQAAIWYFTNYEDSNRYNKYGETSWIWYTTEANKGQYENFSSYNPTGIPYASATAGYFRQQQMVKLYDYLIDTAKSHASQGINDSKTILTVYASNEDTEAQPIMEVYKLPRTFDLSLRKYITEVNGVAVNNTRIPVIDENTLATGTTATYKHRKDPVEVKTNDVITYHMTIYNEGEKAGRASKVVDQLPTGLEFVEVVSGNFQEESYDEETNTVYFTRKANNTTNLPAYEAGTLSSETIEIKCKVTATGGQSDKVLTNMAWIAEEIDEDGTVITNQPGDDRDSEPSTITSKTKDELVTTDNGYIGNTTNSGKDLANEESYFEGQQDDDDFEKVIIRAVTSVEVSKVWEDNSNQDGIRATEIKVELLKNEQATGQFITLNEGNQWSGKFDNLPTKENGQDITYSVRETTTINGYTTNINATTDSTGKSYTITNSHTPETISVSVNKVWDDNNNQDGMRAPEIQVALKKGTQTLQTVTLDGNNNWSHIFAGLAKYENGKEIEYTIEEVNTPEGYTESIEKTTNNNFTITNTHIPEVISITAKKEWYYFHNREYAKPEYVEFELLKNGQPTGEVKQLTAPTWTVTFDNLPVKENGQEIVYTVKEINVPEGYQSIIGKLPETNVILNETIQTTAIGGSTKGAGVQGAGEKEEYTITNVYYPFDLSLRKYITKVGDTDITDRIPNIDTNPLIEGYMGNGDETTAHYKHKKDPVTVKTGDKVIYNLTVYNESLLKVGTATKIEDQLPTGLKFERVISDYYEVESYSETDNLLKLKLKDVNESTRSAIPIPSVEVTLDSITSSDGVNYDLDSITIQVECIVTAEAGSENQILTNVAWISEAYNITDGITITTQEKADADSEPGTKPNVNKDGLVSTDDGYIGNEHNSGKELSNPEEYFEGEQDDDDFEKIVIEAQTQVNVNKVWNDNNNQDGVRPPEIQVQLVKEVGGEKTEIEDKVMILSDDNQWKGTFDHLPVYENGQKITYTVKEMTITGYAVNITQNSENNFTITNTHTPGVTSVNVNKVWDDQNDQDGLRPDSIEVELLKNGEPTGNVIILNEENGWTGAFNNLPVNENGQEIDYTIRENTQIDGYTTEITENTETASNANNTQNLANAEEPEITTQTYAAKDMVRAAVATVEPKSFRITNTHLVEEAFDLSLRKFIVAVSEDETIEENDILMNEDDTGYAREPVVDASNLNKSDENGNTITTAIYNHTKETVLVEKNDIVVYMLRVYNEGEQNGYAAEIKDYLPSYLTFVDGEFNEQYGWEVSEDGRTVTTRYLENSVIAKPQTDASGNNTLSYVEVPIMCRVTDTVNANENITNIADITEYQDKNKQPVEDRDSKEENVQLPTDEELPGYKNEESKNPYVPGQEDDDDFEKVYVEEDKEFDLALRKFINEVDETSYNRAPNVDLSGLESGTTAIYNHTKDPVLVNRNSVIVYTIRVYNEGDMAGYAEKITDYLPEGLTFLPEHEINLQYEWQVSEDGRIVTTDYLSSTKETENRENVIQAFDGQTLDYKEVQIACQVKDSVGTNVKLTNLAEITEDSDEDRDSTPDDVEIPSDEELPGYKDDEIEKDYVPGQEDDDDFEKVIVQDFDLALRKFITKVDEEDVTTRIPEVSYDREQDKITYNHTKDPVEVVTGNVVEYTIRVYNEGDIAGYAEEIADDIPAGLKYLPENETNIAYRWVMYDEEGNVTENAEEAVEIRTDYLSKEQEETGGENLLQAFKAEEEIGEKNPDYRDSI